MLFNVNNRMYLLPKPLCSFIIYNYPVNYYFINKMSLLESCGYFFIYFFSPHTPRSIYKVGSGLLGGRGRQSDGRFQMWGQQIIRLFCCNNEILYMVFFFCSCNVNVSVWIFLHDAQSGSQ